MGFKDWLIKETGTSTADIAGFPRIAIPLVRRMYPPELGGEWPEEKKKKGKKTYQQPQVKD